MMKHRCCICKREMNSGGIPFTVEPDFWESFIGDVSDGICSECFPEEKEKMRKEIQQLKEKGLLL